MPIITPAYPSMNSSFNITKSSMTVIQAELLRADGITDLIAVGKKPWSELFTKHSFFTTDYKYYLAVVSSGITKDAHKKWSGFVESKVRMLVGNLDRHDTIVVAQAFVKGFDRVHECRTDEDIQKVQAGDLSFVVKRDKSADMGKEAEVQALALADQAKEAGANAEVPEGGDSTEAENGTNPADKEANAGEDKPEADTEEGKEGAQKDDDVTEIYTTTHYIGLELRPGSKAINLAHEVGEFKTLCHGWDKFNPELNALSVQHIRRYVFVSPPRVACIKVSSANSSQLATS
jgi:poly(A) polymerase